jgi:hypothetical protein
MAACDQAVEMRRMFGSQDYFVRVSRFTTKTINRHVEMARRRLLVLYAAAAQKVS